MLLVLLSGFILGSIYLWVSKNYFKVPSDEGFAYFWYAILPGMALAYFLLKKYYPDLVGVREQKSVARNIFGWIGTILLVFLVMVILALLYLHWQ